MKILTVVYNLGKGGTQRAAQNFCEGYLDIGHDSRIIATYKGGLRVGELEERNIKVWVDFDEKAIKEIELWSPNVVHIHSHGMRLNDVKKLRQKLNDSIFIETNVFSIPSTYEDILDYSYQLSCWCHYLYCARGGDKKKALVVPCPVNDRRFKKSSDNDIEKFKSIYGIPSDAFLFGRIGQHFYGKWSHYLIDLFSKFINNVDKNCFLITVNPPREIVNYINKKKVSNIVIIDKLVGDKALQDCYSSINVFLHIANQGESFGMVLAESLLCETPAITLSTPWGDNTQCEVIGHDFYLNMLELYYNKDKRIFLGKNGREFIKKKYDYLTVAESSVKALSTTENQYSCSDDFLKNSILPFRIITYLLLKLKYRTIHFHGYINIILRKIALYNIPKGLNKL
jgi:glycosyltransferase involved in cell wall biosynthesis